MLTTRSHHPGIVEITLARPPVNALNPALVSELQRTLDSMFDDGAEAVVLSGAPGMFSAGLDVPELLRLDAGGMRAFWSGFFGLLETLARSPVPVVSALTGHSPAGGTVLALFSDYRVMARGECRMGLNEVQVGLVVPPVIHRALARLIGVYAAERHLMAGAMISAEQALDVGLVDVLAAPEEVVATAVEWCRRHLALPRAAMLGTRRLVRADLAALFEAGDALDIDAFVDGWFRAETQATLQALVARLGKA